MIDPKQKAIDIRFKYWHELDLTPEQANECAKIDVQNTIDASPSLPILGESGTFGEDIELSKIYWQEVLNELNKM